MNHNIFTSKQTMLIWGFGGLAVTCITLSLWLTIEHCLATLIAVKMLSPINYWIFQLNTENEIE